ncbi:Hypothetical predicted protein [Paramuricea clavata]|uniref:Uncharacterized protein n=1 Tax=Paramuricea clavata TaxID=317549 RepID=A0A6S7HHW7_PARCT|nr:Hypothetical predicted protein [Paramuricea clavata]
MHSTFHVQNGNFRTCGEIVATSITQGGSSPCFLQPCAFDALWKELDVLNISDEDLTKRKNIRFSTRTSSYLLKIKKLPLKIAAPIACREGDDDGIDGEAFQSTSSTAEDVLEEADLSVAGIMGLLTGQKHKHMFEKQPTITVHFHECLACGKNLTLPVAHMKSKEEFKNIFVNGQEFAKP